MVRERGATFVGNGLTKAINFASAAVLLIGIFLSTGPALAQPRQVETCPTGRLNDRPGGGNFTNPPDLLIDHECHVGIGWFGYNNVNIISGGPPGNRTHGKLIFVEDRDGTAIEFFAQSIVVENGGSLEAGTADKPFGSRGGRLTIHLFGKDQGVGGTGIICKSTTDFDGHPTRPGQCGIPNSVWDSAQAGPLPGGVTDRFYPYTPLPFDDGKVDGLTGYFGYKVLAVSYGGSLKLFGKLGAAYATLQPKDAGTSWVRLASTIVPCNEDNKYDCQTLKLSRPVDWHVGNLFVVTTTDYLPNHAEELVVCGMGLDHKTIYYSSDLSAIYGNCRPGTGVQWAHNGEQYSLSQLPARLKITKTVAETRAAVGLLSRNIRIVSEGDVPAGCGFPPCDAGVKDLRTDYSFGGHTVARQGFAAFQVQGVEFRQLGQGGKMGHYPIHFHVARKTPPNTFVRDSSINESMNRWITVHGTQGVEFARNVGYKSIGHGFYLEDAVETNNKFYSNLGVFARAAVMNQDGTPTNDNPRKVPGILASPDDTPGNIRFGSDKSTPSVFWITNGWNDFQGNMAAGAGMCGVCYWEVPASIGGHSRHEDWESYASEQTAPRSGSSPLMNFDGNSCTSAMTAFQTVGYTQSCPGVGINQLAIPVENPYAPRSTAITPDDPDKRPPECGPNGSNKNWPMCPNDYYPNVENGQLKQATKCPDTGKCDDSNLPAATLCQESDEKNCLPTIINDLTTSFNYSEFNFSAVWLRTRWHLISNSFISDVQNAGLTFISGGDYTHSSAIKGLWEEALQNVFVGETQPQPPDPKANPYASVLSPFNKATAALGLKCDNSEATQQNYCISVANSFVLGQYTGFAVSQHMFNIYDGPANEDSNVYLDIKKTDLGTSSDPSVYKRIGGIPKAVQVDPNAPNIPQNACFIQNAAIAWKQPNGFYYPPTFHSKNLFFKNTNIFHYVIVPQFEKNKYTTDKSQVAARYCPPPPGFSFDRMFDGFSAIDRQTELSDDDGSLTGYAKTTSVNEDPFFAAPVDGIECQSEGATPEGGTARTSPYDYVTSVVYPDDAQFAKPLDPEPGRTCGRDKTLDPNWDSECSNQSCFGVPLYRVYQTGSEHAASLSPEFIRMAGMNICQRETMNVNHGHYYVDLTASAATQAKPLSNLLPPKKNIFVAGKKYDFFLVYAKKNTEQTYQMYVGPGFDPDAAVKLIRADTVNAPFVVCPNPDQPKCASVPIGGDTTTLKKSYDSSNGVLTVTLNLSAFAHDFASAAKDLCVPENFCQFSDKDNTCIGKSGGLGNLTPAERNITCGRAGEDVDCPKGGCVGFSVTLPPGFKAEDQTTANNSALVNGLATCFPKDANWNVTPIAAPGGLAGACVGKNAPIKMDFCASR
jgi:hypothetical protein